MQSRQFPWIYFKYSKSFNCSLYFDVIIYQCSYLPIYYAICSLAIYFQISVIHEGFWGYNRIERVPGEAEEMRGDGALRRGKQAGCERLG